MIKEAIEKILGLAQPEYKLVMDQFGVETTFSSRPVHEVKAAAGPVACTLPVNSLVGMRDAIVAELEHIGAKGFAQDYILHVQDYQTVALLKKNTDIYGRRVELIHAYPCDFQKFMFGQWYDQEQFVIAVASLFADGGDKAYVLQLASSLTQDATSLSEDDGFSQKVNIKAGLRTKETLTVKPKVTLAPFRTFPEVPQPESDFVFRARANGDSAPKLALYEADGGRWKNEAMKTIAAEIESWGLGIPVIR